jgi:hypothetical protein
MAEPIATPADQNISAVNNIPNQMGQGVADANVPAMDNTAVNAVANSTPIDQYNSIGNPMQTQAAAGPSQVGMPAPQPTPISPDQPHARLMSMLQGLFVGVGAFGKAIATHGKEGGVQDVQQYYAEQQREQIQKQQAEQQKQESDIRIKSMTAQMHINEINLQKSLLTFPMEIKQAQLSLLNSTVDAFTKTYDEGSKMGYDMDDPAQSAQAKQRMGIGDAANQPGAFTVPSTGDMRTADVMKAIQSSIPAGKSMTDYTFLTTHNDNTHGNGTSTVAVPNDSAYMKMPATPRQISTSQAEVKSMLAQAQQLGLGDDPQVKQLQGQFQNFSNALAAAQKNGAPMPSTLDVHMMHMSVVGPLATLVAGGLKANQDAKDIAQTKDAQLKVQPPSQGVLAAFAKTVSSLNVIPPKERQGYLAEGTQARTVDELDKVQQAVMQAANRYEMKNATISAARIQAASNKEAAFANAGLTANEKLWTDPQHGYLNTVQSTNQLRAGLTAAKDGNGLMTSFAPTMAVLGINVSQGVHRISPAEAQAANLPGGWAEQFNAWLTKATTGKMSPQLVAEGQKLADILQDNAYTKALQGAQVTSNGHRIPAAQVPATYRDGSITTLDKAVAENNRHMQAQIPPQGARGYIRGSDGRNYWSADGRTPIMNNGEPAVAE